MTSERRRAIIVVVATLLAGILIGALGQAILARQTHRFDADGKDGKREGRDDRGKKRFIAKVYRVTKATDAQKIVLEPILKRSTSRFDSLRLDFEKAAKKNLDSLFVELEGHLDPAQLQDLKEYFQRWDGNRGRR